MMGGVIFAVAVAALFVGIGLGIWACFRSYDDFEELDS